MPNKEMNSVDAVGMLDALLRNEGANKLLRWDVATARFILKNVAVVGNPAPQLEIYFEYSTPYDETIIKAGGTGRLNFEEGGGRCWIRDRVFRCAGVHILDTNGHHTAMLQYGTPGILRFSPETPILFGAGFNHAESSLPLRVGIRAALTDEIEVISDAWGGTNDAGGRAQSRLRLRAGGRLRADSWSMMTMGTQASRVTNVAQINLGYDGTLAVGDVVRITGAADTSFNGTFTLTQASAATVQYSNAGSNVSPTNGEEIRIERMTQKIVTRAVTSNVATITVATQHGLCNGQWVAISGMTDATYNGVFRITTASATAFNYALTHANESATADTTGTITSMGVLELGGTSGLILLNDVDTVTGTTVQATLAGSILRPTALAADVNDYAPGRARTYVLTTSGGSRAITGIIAGWDGEERFLFNNNASGGSNVTLSNASGSSVAANRFSLPGATTLTIAPQTTQRIWYDGTAALWKV